MKKYLIIIAIIIAGLSLLILSSLITPQEKTSYNQEEYGYFGDSECSDDCSGHKAGWNWAEEKNITNPDNCGGRSQSFIEGCIDYASEN